MSNTTQTVDALTTKLREAVSIAKADLDGEPDIAPALLAAEAMKRLDPEQRAPSLVAWGCNLELRQIAREVLRNEHDPVVKVQRQTQPGLFEGLQERYPVKGDDGEFVYRLRMLLTIDQRRSNIKRMRLGGRAILRHADGLEAETEALIAQGFFDTAASS